MSVYAGKNWLENLRQRWILSAALKTLVYALVISCVVEAIVRYLLDVRYLSFLITLIVSTVIQALLKHYWTLGLSQVSSYADRKFPELEDSSGLLIVPEETLSPLQHIQRTKIDKVLSAQKVPMEPFYQLRLPTVLLLFSLAGLYFSAGLKKQSVAGITQSSDATTHSVRVKEQIPAQMKGYALTISPPAYTGRKQRNQEQFTLRVESGSVVTWRLSTSIPVQNLSLIWNDKEQLRLRKIDADGTTWAMSKILDKPGFYQVVLDGKKSDFYQVDIIPDQPVGINILTPAQHSTIDFGQPHQVNLKMMMTDDYGIKDAVIHATTASGKGEAVSFKSHKIKFNVNFNNQRTMNIHQQLRLDEMGMKAGDELYFYINATDNHGQQSRSDMYFVSIQDTAALMSLAGIDNGVNLVPEYFRSQRQIIIDTEKLLRERSSISDADFKKRSNDLGIDQKMLRLRYGKFLGEEEETNIGGGAEAHDEHHDEDGHGHSEGEKAPAYGDVQGLMDQYAHKHDQAEDATFFEPALKTQLKATLNEMWSAELKLRVYEPVKALPFEYKALRLLKDLQQKSRAYVAKTVVKTTPLKAEKRLSGELAEIAQPLAVNKAADGEEKLKTLKAALSIIENRKLKVSGDPAEMNTLRAAEQLLLKAASTAPSKYLPSLAAMKRSISLWTSRESIVSELGTSQKGVRALIGNIEPRPYRSQGSVNDLSAAYFNQLNRTKR